MGEAYTNGVWMVKAGEEEAFVAAWREFASWGQTWPGCATFRLVRDVRNPSRYMSFGDWESLDAQQAWKDHPEFKARIRRVQEHVDDFQPSLFELVSAIE
jgi:heme-degrading monooxygenase HmoA